MTLLPLRHIPCLRLIGLGTCQPTLKRLIIRLDCVYSHKSHLLENCPVCRTRQFSNKESLCSHILQHVDEQEVVAAGADNNSKNGFVNRRPTFCEKPTEATTSFKLLEFASLEVPPPETDSSKVVIYGNPTNDERFVSTSLGLGEVIAQFSLPGLTDLSPDEMEDNDQVRIAKIPEEQKYGTCFESNTKLFLN